MRAVTCRADSPLRCEARARSMDAGDFKYLWGWGWIWFKAQNPTVPFRECPFCGQPLPTMEGIVERGLREGFDSLHEQRQADGGCWTGEDRG